MLTINREEYQGDYPISGVLENRAPFRYSTIESQNKQPLLKFSMPGVNLQNLTNSVNEALEIYGHWNYRIGVDEHGVRHDRGYGGLGLTYNPLHKELENTDIHEQVQGNPSRAMGKQNPYSQLTKDEALQFSKRNSHYDTYGLSYRTPASKHGYLGTFLDSFKRTMIRSAVRIIYADQEGQVGEEKLAGVRWHKDESMFENLRVNIPIVTDPIFELEQEGYPPVHLETGYAYSWDTNILHRAYAKERAQKHRIHLMLGFSCWWDFDEKTGNWTQNEFFGKKHPKDMLVDGDVIPNLVLL